MGDTKKETQTNSKNFCDLSDNRQEADLYAGLTGTNEKDTCPKYQVLSSKPRARLEERASSCNGRKDWGVFFKKHSYLHFCHPH